MCWLTNGKEVRLMESWVKDTKFDYENMDMALLVPYPKLIKTIAAYNKCRSKEFEV